LITWSVVVFCILLATGCDQQKSGKIEWQLPLSAPEDPHGAETSQSLPQWATQYQGTATISLLQKSTARVRHVQVMLGDTASLDGVDIRLLGLAEGLRIKSGSYIDDQNVHNPAAFVDVEDHGKEVYRGWLYQEFPELFGPDMADWKVSLEHITIAASPESENQNPDEAQGTRP